jgi:KUP system potassium uptake protein
MDIKEIIKDDRIFSDRTKYQSAIGGLIYLASSYRPDISTAVSQLATCNNNPNESAWRAVVRLYGFLLETKDKKLVYKKTKNDSELFIIEIFVD